MLNCKGLGRIFGHKFEIASNSTKSTAPEWLEKAELFSHDFAESANACSATTETAVAIFCPRCGEIKSLPSTPCP